MRDEDFYGLAVREIVERTFIEALLAKAYALALGDPEKTKALYIRMRADQLKEKAALLAADVRERKIKKEATEKASKKESVRQRAAAEKQKEKEEALARRRLAEAEAQRVGDAWSRGETQNRDWMAPSKNDSLEKAKEPNPSPPMSMEELDKIVESLKKALNSKPSFF